MIKFILKILNKTKYLYYIGRHDILPPPLKGIEEKEALEKLGAGDNDARDLLIEHNLRLVVYVAKRYDTTQNGGIEDLISIGTIGLVKAINTFKPDKNIKLATYASRCIENEILMFLRKNNKLRHEISLDEPFYAIVLDRGGAIYGGHLDLYIGSESSGAVQHVLQTTPKVQIVRSGA